MLRNVFFNEVCLPLFETFWGFGEQLDSHFLSVSLFSFVSYNVVMLFCPSSFFPSIVILYNASFYALIALETKKWRKLSWEWKDEQHHKESETKTKLNFWNLILSWKTDHSPLLFLFNWWWCRRVSVHRVSWEEKTFVPSKSSVVVFRVSCCVVPFGSNNGQCPLHPFSYSSFSSCVILPNLFSQFLCVSIWSPLLWLSFDILVLHRVQQEI